jgi:hypothetical protein
MRIHTYAETLNALIRVIEESCPWLEEIFRGAANVAAKSRVGLSILDFIRPAQAHLSQIVLVGVDTVLQVCCEA